MSAYSWPGPSQEDEILVELLTIFIDVAKIEMRGEMPEKKVGTGLMDKDKLDTIIIKLAGGFSHIISNPTIKEMGEELIEVVLNAVDEDCPELLEYAIDQLTTTCPSAITKLFDIVSTKYPQYKSRLEKLIALT